MVVDTCVFCQRVVETCRHHIIPKSKGGRTTVAACKDCETFIHRTLTHVQLRDDYNTVESILAFEPYQKFRKWLMKQQPDARFPSVRKIGEKRPKGRDPRQEP